MCKCPGMSRPAYVMKEVRCLSLVITKKFKFKRTKKLNCTRNIGK